MARYGAKDASQRGRKAGGRGRNTTNECRHPKMKFYDVKGRKSFTSSTYRPVTRGKTKFIVTKAPSGIESWRIVGRKK